MANNFGFVPDGQTNNPTQANTNFGFVPDGGSVSNPQTGPSNVDSTTPDFSKVTNFFGNLGNDYVNATKGITSAIGGGTNQIMSGANDLSQGNIPGAVGNIARGVTQGVLGGVGNTIGAAFAPVSEIAKSITPQTNNPWVDSATQGAGIGTTIAGPEGGLVGAGLGLGLQGLNALEQGLLKIPKVAQFAQNNPDIIPDINNALNVGLASLGMKGGAEDIMTKPISEVPSTIAKNLGDTLSTVTGGASQLYKAIVQKSPDQIDSYINDKYQKAIRPSVSGKNTSAQLDRSFDQTALALRTIAENKDNLQIMNADGEPTGKLPTTLNEFVQGLDQTRQQIFQQYDSMQKMAGMAGATVDLGSTASQLDTIANNKVVQDNMPKLADYARQKADMFRQRGTYSTQEAQDAIALYNKSLDAFYKHPSYETASQAGVDSMIVAQLRQGLDSSIENVSQQMVDQPGYQDLKNKYAALKSIEKDVVHRAVVAGRQAPVGMLSGVLNAGTAVELMRGLLTMNPADFAGSLGLKAIDAYIKYQNSPNTAISRLFSVLDKVPKAKPVAIPPPMTTGFLRLPAPSGETITNNGLPITPPAPTTYEPQTPSGTHTTTNPLTGDQYIRNVKTGKLQYAPKTK